MTPPCKTGLMLIIIGLLLEIKGPPLSAFSVFILGLGMFVVLLSKEPEFPPATTPEPHKINPEPHLIEPRIPLSCNLQDRTVLVNFGTNSAVMVVIRDLGQSLDICSPVEKITAENQAREPLTMRINRHLIFWTSMD